MQASRVGPGRLPSLIGGRACFPYFGCTGPMPKWGAFDTVRPFAGGWNYFYVRGLATVRSPPCCMRGLFFCRQSPPTARLHRHHRQADGWRWSRQFLPPSRISATSYIHVSPHYSVDVMGKLVASLQTILISAYFELTLHPQGRLMFKLVTDSLKIVLNRGPIIFVAGFGGYRAPGVISKPSWAPKAGWPASWPALLVAAVVGLMDGLEMTSKMVQRMERCSGARTSPSQSR